MNEVEELVSKFPELPEFEKINICSQGTREIYLSKCGEYAIKSYYNYSGFESNLKELLISIECSHEDKDYINPVTHASILGNRVLIACKRIKTPVTYDELKSSTLYPKLRIEHDDSESFVFIGDTIVIDDVTLQDGLLHNLGVTSDNNIVVLDYGSSELRKNSKYDPAIFDYEDLYLVEDI